MRTITLVLSFLLLVNFSNGLAKVDKVLELNKENLTLLALNHSPAATIEQKVVRLAKDRDIRAYYQAKKDKEKYKVLLNSVRKELKGKMQAIGKMAQFKLIQEVRVKVADEKTGAITVRNLLNKPLKAIASGEENIQGLPAYYLLLFANTELLDKITIKPEKIQKLKEKSRNGRLNNLFSEVIVTISTFQNNQEFQVKIDKITLYTDKSRKEKLTTVKDSRSYQEVTKNWLLSEGYTNKLIGIHSFDVYGYRVQDMLIEVKKHGQFCKKTKRIDKHQVIECKKPLSDNTYLAIIYVGGIMSQFSIMAKPGISQKEYNRIIFKLSVSLSKPKSFFTEGLKNWKKFSVNFNFFPLNPAEETKKERLIFNMISDATKELLNLTNKAKDKLGKSS